MADNEMSESESRLEYKDGQLQIVEVMPVEKDVMLDGEVVNSLSELEGEGETKYVQLVNAGDDILNRLNLTLVKCADGTETFRLVANDSEVTCVLATSDNEANEDSDGQEAYMMMEDQSPIMYIQSALPETQLENEVEQDVQIVETPSEKIATVEKPGTTKEKKVPKLSATEILERAKAFQRAKAGLIKTAPTKQRGRKRKTDLPPPHELLSSPGFKLFLYSCKQCSFKCNAVREMTAHKKAEHGSTANNSNNTARFRGARGDKITLQCARCPYKGLTHLQYMRHVQDAHLSKETKESNKVYLNTEEVAAADVLVCGACGFESSSRLFFKKHIEKEHGATAV